jgi:ABC-type transport system substrate-binding protein
MEAAMRRIFLVSAVLLLTLTLAVPSPCLAQEWKVRGYRGTLKVVDLWNAAASLRKNYAEGLVTLDSDNNTVPCLAEDWRWVDDRTIEFELRKGVTFHNGEEFNAEAVKVNWEEYRKMERPTDVWFNEIPDDTAFEIIDQYTVRFVFPEP